MKLFYLLLSSLYCMSPLRGMEAVKHSEGTITLQTSDGIELEIEIRYANLSETIKSLFN